MYNKIKNWNRIKQKSIQWFDERNKIITATDVSSILEINPFVSKYEVLQNKLQPIQNIQPIQPIQNIQNIQPIQTIQNISNPAIEWGDVHEPIAKDIYNTLPLIDGPRKIHDVGLIYHSKYEWLAASPDGIVESLEKNCKNKWWVLEIKCPYKRDFKNKGHTIPDYIWTQIQIQMEVCDLPFCHLLQCKFIPDTSSNKTLLSDTKITTIFRNQEWFNTIAFPKLFEFWNIILKAKNYNSFVNPYPNPKEWIPFHSFTGFLLKDPILDWLNMFSETDTIKNITNKYYIPKDKDNIKDKKNTFKLIIEKLKKFSNENNKSIIFISDEENFISLDKYEKTKKALNDKIDIIVRPLLLDYQRKIYGSPDIIIKNNVVLEFLKTYSKKTNIDILQSNDSYTLLNITIKTNNNLTKWDNVVKEKYIGYSSILNSITNQSQSFISIGINNCIVFNLNIDCEKINNAVSWIKTLKENGNEWLNYIKTNTVPTNSFIMPNMCNYIDQKWRPIKKELAEKWGELTLLWYCGINQRNRAHSKGIYSWKSLDKTPEEIVLALYENISFSKRKNIIHSMISLNRTDKVFSSRNMGELTDPFMDTQNCLEIYIDFEVIPKKNISNIRYQHDMIYLIGMKWKCKDTNVLCFQSFITDTINLSSEKEMILRWWDTVRKLKKETKSDKVIIYHWSPAEERFLNNAFKRHTLSNIKNSLQSGLYELRDLMEMYIEAEVIIRNVWGYSVKNIAKGLYKHNFIPEVWDDNEKGGDNMSGELTITTANKCYNDIKKGISITENSNFILLRDYNEMDCTVLYYLLLFLRNHIYTKDPRQLRKNKRNRTILESSLESILESKKHKV